MACDFIESTVPVLLVDDCESTRLDTTRMGRHMRKAAFLQTESKSSNKKKQEKGVRTSPCHGLGKVKTRWGLILVRTRNHPSAPLRRRDVRQLKQEKSKMHSSFYLRRLFNKRVISSSFLLL